MRINPISTLFYMLVMITFSANITGQQIKSIPGIKNPVTGADQQNRLNTYPSPVHERPVHSIPEMDGSQLKEAYPAEWEVTSGGGNSSDNVLLDEGFESWEPENWSFYQLGVQWLGWQQSDFQPHTGEYSAYHGFFSGGIHNNWMVTPQLTIDEEYNLIFWDRLTAYSYYSYSGVLISTGSGDPEDDEFVEIYNADEAIPSTWTEHLLDLSDYVGENIYIAFQYSGNNAHAWYVDDVKVVPLTYTDGGISGIINPPVGMTTTGGSMEEVTVKLKNFGTDLIEAASIEWIVNGESQIPFEITELGLSSGESTELMIGTYDFSLPGDYEVEVTCIIENDQNPANDSFSGIYSVVDLGNTGITNIWPNGSLGAAIINDVVVRITNFGSLSLESVEVDWKINDIPQTPFIATNLNLLPGQSTNQTIGEFDFSDPGIYTIFAETNLPIDYVPANDSMRVQFASGVLWESFEGPHDEFWPPDHWMSLNASALMDWPYEGQYMGHILSGESEFGSTDGWFATPLLDISDGDEITFQLSNDMMSGGGFSVQWMDGETGDLYLIQNISVSPGDWYEKTIDISAAAGINRIVFHVSSSGYAEAFLDVVTSTAPTYTFEQDLEVMRFIHNWTPFAQVEDTIQCKVRNYTANSVEMGEYTVKLMEEPGIELASISGDAINPMQTLEYEFVYTFNDKSQHNLYIEIDYASDQDLDDNTSNIVSVYPVPVTTQTAYIGTAGNTNLNIPFDTFGTEGLGEDDFTQIIYHYDEIGSMGYIYGLKFHYALYALIYGQELPLTVWIGETANEDLSGGWEPYDIMTQVFDSIVITKNYEHEMFIPFDEPYVYTGGNIVIQIIQHDPSFPASWTSFSTTPSPGLIRSAKSPDWYEIDPENPPSFEWESQHWQEFPDATFIFDPFAEIAEVNGTVYDENNQPIENALIHVEGTSIDLYSDEQGNYSIPNLPYGEWEITSIFLGYEDNTQTLTIDENYEVLDFTMIPRPLVTVSGQLEGSDQPDTGLQGVNISITGYNGYNDMSGEDGGFSLEVFGNAAYEILLSKFGYEPFSTSLILSDEDLNLGTIILQERLISVFNAIAAEDPDDVVGSVFWPDPLSGMEDTLQFDTGNESYGLANEPYENVWLGNLMPNSETITITSVTVFFLNNPQFSGQVQLDIFDADENLLVSSEPFYTQNDSYLTINFPNLTYDGDLYIMLHWQNNPNTTHFLGIDFTYGINDLCYIGYPGEGFQLLSSYLGTTPGIALIRANVLKPGDEKGPQGNKVVSSYNVYRGLSNDLYDFPNWTQVNSGPVNDLEYMDESWLYVEPNTYRYAIEAVYTGGIAEVTYTNSLIIDFILPSGLTIDADPVSGETLFSWTSPEHNVQSYEIFLDDMSNPVATGVTELSYVFENLTPAPHTAGVKAIYNTGESGIETIEFVITGIAPFGDEYMQLFPNPASTYFNLTHARGSDIILLDMSGRVQMQFTCEDEEQKVNVSGLENGMYILRIINDGKAINRKIEISN